MPTKPKFFVIAPCKGSYNLCGPFPTEEKAATWTYPGPTEWTNPRVVRADSKTHLCQLIRQGAFNKQTV